MRAQPAQEHSDEESLDAEPVEEGDVAPHQEVPPNTNRHRLAPGLADLLRFFYSARVTSRLWAEFVRLMGRPDVREHLPRLHSRLSYYNGLLDEARPANDTWTRDPNSDVRAFDHCHDGVCDVSLHPLFFVFVLFHSSRFTHFLTLFPHVFISAP